MMRSNKEYFEETFMKGQHCNMILSLDKTKNFFWENHKGSEIFFYILNIKIFRHVYDNSENFIRTCQKQTKTLGSKINF